jgi:repressor LexA
MMSDSRQRLTTRQEQVLEIIQQAITRDGYPPTIREIGQHLGIKSTNGVNDHLKALERKGYLRRGEAKSRAIVPITLDTDWVDVPLLGRIAAGAPILAVENVEDTVRVDRFFLGRTSGEVFALRVVGESMIGDGIHDGDFIFVKKQPQAPKGEIVVAMIDGEATVKRYYPEGDRIRFEPSNPAMSSIYVLASDFRETMIIGVVVGLYRMV